MKFLTRVVTYDVDTLLLSMVTESRHPISQHVASSLTNFN